MLAAEGVGATVASFDLRLNQAAAADSSAANSGGLFPVTGKIRRSWAGHASPLESKISYVVADDRQGRGRSPNISSTVGASGFGCSRT